MTFASYGDAAAALPDDAVWSCSFGNPGEPGYCEYHRARERRYVISNGKWPDADDQWTIEEVAS